MPGCLKILPALNPGGPPVVVLAGAVVGVSVPVDTVAGSRLAAALSRNSLAVKGLPLAGLIPYRNAVCPPPVLAGAVACASV